MHHSGLLKMSQRDQLLNLLSELSRAQKWEETDRENFLASLERSLQLIDVLFEDPKWKGNFYPLLVLREMVARVYIGEEKVGNVLKVI